MSHRVPGFHAVLWFRNPALCQGRPNKSVIMAEASLFLSPTWRTGSSSWVQPSAFSLLADVHIWRQNFSLFVRLSLCLSASLSDPQIKKKSHFVINMKCKLRISSYRKRVETSKVSELTLFFSHRQVRFEQDYVNITSSYILDRHKRIDFFFFCFSPTPPNLRNSKNL